jgi:hypothetical protein
MHGMTYIDTNIFRDVSTTKNQIPSEDAIYSELKDKTVKILRLKTSVHWLCYIGFTATKEDWYLKQEAMLNCDNPDDTLLKNVFDFLDVNDLATINRISEDSAH